MRLPFCLVAASWFVCAQAACAADSRSEPLTVFAAASLTDTLQKVNEAYAKATGAIVKASFAASSTLARQIEAGAQADIFFSADQEWMDYAEQRRLTRRVTRFDLLGNRLALIAPHDSAVNLELERNAPLRAALGPRGRLAIGDPDSAPAGKYARAALMTLGLWRSVESRLARAENVRVALSYVARGEAPLGVVYATDVAVEPKVRIVDLFPEGSHAPITYPVAATSAASRAAEKYLAFLRSPAAAKIFSDAGFVVLEVTSD